MKPQGGLSLLARLITALCCLSGLVPGALALRQGQAQRRLLVSALHGGAVYRACPVCGRLEQQARAAGERARWCGERTAGTLGMPNSDMCTSCLGRGRQRLGSLCRRGARLPARSQDGGGAAAAAFLGVTAGCDHARAGCDRAATGCTRRRRTGPRCTTMEQWCHPTAQMTWAAI